MDLVGRDDHPAAGDLLADQLGGKLLAAGNRLHLGGNDCPARAYSIWVMAGFSSGTEKNCSRIAAAASHPIAPAAIVNQRGNAKGRRHVARCLSPPFSTTDKPSLMLKINAIRTDNSDGTRRLRASPSRPTRERKSPSKEPWAMPRHHATPASNGDISRSQGPETAIHITHLAHSKRNSDTTLLAQIPDMSFDEPDSFLEERAAGDGRIISQSLAGKLVISGGILLVLAAVLPFLAPAQRTDLKPVQSGLSAWAPRRSRMPPWRPAWSGGASPRGGDGDRSPSPRLRSSSRRRPSGSPAMPGACRQCNGLAASRRLNAQAGADAASQCRGGNLPANPRIGQAAVEMNRPDGHLRPRWRRAGANRRRRRPARRLSASRSSPGLPRQGDCRQADGENRPDYRQNELRANDRNSLTSPQNALRANDPRQADYRQGNTGKAITGRPICATTSATGIATTTAATIAMIPAAKAAPTSPIMPDLNREFSPTGPQSPSSAAPPPPPEPPAGSAAPTAALRREPIPRGSGRRCRRSSRRKQAWCGCKAPSRTPSTN